MLSENEKHVYSGYMTPEQEQKFRQLLNEELRWEVTHNEQFNEFLKRVNEAKNDNIR